MGWTHLRDEQPVARKPYRCFLCGRAIAAGVRHIKRSGIGEGGFDSFRMHIACEQQTRDWDDMTWENFSEGELADYIEAEPTGQEPLP